MSRQYFNMVDITDFSVNSDTNALNHTFIYNHTNYIYNHTNFSLSHKINQSDGFGQNQSVNKNVNHITEYFTKERKLRDNSIKYLEYYEK